MEGVVGVVGVAGVVGVEPVVVVDVELLAEGEDDPEPQAQRTTSNPVISNMEPNLVISRTPLWI